MDFGTIGGVVIGVVCVIVGIMIDGVLGDYFDMASIMIVLGGVLSATLISYPMDSLKSIFKVIGIAFKKEKVDFHEDIEEIIKIAEMVRREGLLVAEEVLDNNGNQFLVKGLRQVIDGVNSDLVKEIMEAEIVLARERHSQGQAVLYSMSSYAPAFGMIGTLIGLINMLGKLDDPSTLGPSMAVALVTTFYGCILANLIFTPLAKKLSVISDTEALKNELVMEGILAIQNGDHPRIIREKLNTFLLTAKKTSDKKVQKES